MTDSASLKRCPCPDHEGERMLPVSEFGYDRSTPDHLAPSCRACVNRRAARYRRELREAVFDYYGRACACCGATEDLSIDHVYGGGREHRLELFGRDGAGSRLFYAWLIDQGFPPGYQVLCKPCNTSKGNGVACRLDHSAKVARDAPEDSGDPRCGSCGYLFTALGHQRKCP